MKKKHGRGGQLSKLQSQFVTINKEQCQNRKTISRWSVCLCVCLVGLCFQKDNCDKTENDRKKWENQRQEKRVKQSALLTTDSITE